MVEFCSVEHFERILSKNSKGLSPEEKKRIAGIMRYMLLTGFEDGQLGKPMERHSDSKELSKTERKIAREYYKMYKTGYDMGKGVR